MGKLNPCTALIKCEDKLSDQQGTRQIDMSEKKRRAQRESNGQPSKRKSLSTAPNATIKVRHLQGPDIAKPIIGISMSA